MTRQACRLPSIRKILVKNNHNPEDCITFGVNIFLNSYIYNASICEPLPNNGLDDLTNIRHFVSSCRHTVLYAHNGQQTTFFSPTWAHFLPTWQMACAYFRSPSLAISAE
jgi:hypothetical protein